MPKTPRFKSETAQKAAIGVVMTIVFAVVLGLAVWYSHAKSEPTPPAAESDLERQSIGGLSLKLPRAWDVRSGLLRAELFAEPPTQLNDPTPEARRLLIGRLAAPPQTTLAAVTRLALLKLRGVFPSILVEGSLDLEPFRNESIVGVRMKAMDRQTPAGSEVRYYHYIAVVTAQGQTYWLIHLQARALADRDERHERLFLAICQSAELAEGQVDEGRRVEHGGVSFTLPAELRAASTPGSDHAHPPRVLLPHGKDQHYLARLRLRGEIDLPANDDDNANDSDNDNADPSPGDNGAHSNRDASVEPASPDDVAPDAAPHAAATDGDTESARSADPVSAAASSLTDPAALLRRAFSQMHQREPEADELLHVGGDRPRWRLILSRPQELSLARELWYARIGGGRGVLIELLCDEAGHNEMIAAVESLIDSAQPASSVSSGSANDSAWEQARQRGVELAAAQRRAVAGHTGWRYTLYTVESRAIAGQVDLTYERPDQPQPVRGRQLQLNQQGDQLEAMWWAERDGSLVDLIWTRQSPRGFGGVHRVTRRLRWSDETLALYDDPTFVAERPIWSVASPAGFLPEPAEQTWSLDALYNAAEASPAMVHRTEGGLPAPHWVAARRLTDNAAVELGLPEAAAVVTVRPMLTMDGHTRLLNADGAVLAGVWRVAKPTPHEDQRIEMRTVDARRLQRAFPSLSATLRLWQQEVAAQ